MVLQSTSLYWLRSGVWRRKNAIIVQSSSHGVVVLAPSEVGSHAVWHRGSKEVKFLLVNSLQIVDHVPANSRCAARHRVSAGVASHAVHCSRHFRQNRANIDCYGLTSLGIGLPAEKWIRRRSWIQLKQHSDSVLATRAEQFASVEVLAENLHFQVIVSLIECVL